MTVEEIIAKWEAQVSGTQCGCPSCSKNLLDEMGVALRRILAERKKPDEPR